MNEWKINNRKIFLHFKERIFFEISWVNGCENLLSLIAWVEHLDGLTSVVKWFCRRMWNPQPWLRWKLLQKILIALGFLFIHSKLCSFYGFKNILSILILSRKSFIVNFMHKAARRWRKDKLWQTNKEGSRIVQETKQFSLNNIFPFEENIVSWTLERNLLVKV